MTPAARVAAAIEVLDTILSGAAAEKALTNWARGHRFAGSGDRAAIRDHVFSALRCRRSFAAIGGALTGRGLMIGQVRAAGGDLAAIFSGQGFAPAPLASGELENLPDPNDLPDDVAMDLPDWIQPRFQDSLGPLAGSEAALLRERAPVFLRVNLRKSSVEAAQESLLKDRIQTKPHPLAGTALEVTENARRVQQSAAFRDGLVELQDAASQALCEFLPDCTGLKVLDFCAGGGGKALAMAGRMQAQFFAHDAKPGRMKDLPVRAERAGVDIRLLDGAQVADEGPFDMVLCDVPCSGSGSWRRSPEGKWNLTPQGLAELNRTQSAILSQVAPLVAPAGWLAYATCSVLRSENDDRIADFLAAHPDWRVQGKKQFLLQDGGDGFFVAVLRRIS